MVRELALPLDEGQVARTNAYLHCPSPEMVAPEPLGHAFGQHVSEDLHIFVGTQVAGSGQ